MSRFRNVNRKTLINVNYNLHVNDSKMQSYMQMLKISPQRFLYSAGRTFGRSEDGGTVGSFRRTNGWTDLYIYRRSFL